MEEDKAGSNPRQSHVVQAGPNPEPMHKDFIAIVYPQVHEILKLTTKEHIHIKNPPSSSGTLPSMKNLDDAFTFVLELATRVSVLEKICVNFEKKNKLQDKTTQALSSRVYTLENHDLYSKIDKYVNEVVKEAVHNALQAPIRDRLRDLSKFEMKDMVYTLENHDLYSKIDKYVNEDKTTQALSSKVYTLENHDLYSKIDKYVNEVVKEAVHNALQAPILDRLKDLSEFEMKEILHDRMFESGSYRSHLEHTALYDALVSSMDRENREEFNEEMAKSRKRRRDDQDPSPPPPKDSDQSKNKRHDSDASASKQPPPIDDAPIPNDAHLSNSEDTSAAHLLKIKTRPDWLKPLLEEETDALAKTYKDPEEFNLLQKTRDIGSFIKWYCKQIGKSKLVIADLEGDKERRNALSISKLKAAYYPDFELEEVELSL
ncbi:hypothetical protein Tco_1261106 [Tanacetum coccineum]